MSVYLQTGDYANFGVPNATAAQVAQASALIDAYLLRPEGLIWKPDGAGMPAYMDNLTAAYTLTAPGTISAGDSVPVPVTGPVAALQVGDVLILDRANTTLTEAVVVAAISGATITLKNVAFTHAASTSLEYGLVIEEQRYLPENRPVTFASRTPLLRVIAGVGRYAYGRRGDAANYQMDEFNLLAALSKFGGPPVWEIFQPLNLSLDVQTGQIWVPAGVMLAYYSEVKFRYVAGYSTVNLPAAIKLACASLINAQINSTQLGNVRSYKAGDTAIERFAATLLDDDTKQALNLFRAHTFV